MTKYQVSSIKEYWNSLNGERIVIAVITAFSSIGITMGAWGLTTLWDMNGTMKEMNGAIATIARSDAEQAQKLLKHTDELLDHEKRLIILEIRSAAERERTNRTTPRAQ